MTKVINIPNSIMISQTLLSELKTIVKEDYGVSLKPKELSDFADTLLNFFESLIRIENKLDVKEENSATQNGGDNNEKQSLVYRPV